MASLIRNSPIENLFARPAEALPRRPEAEQSFDDVLSRTEPLAGRGRAIEDVSPPVSEADPLPRDEAEGRDVAAVADEAGVGDEGEARPTETEGLGRGDSDSSEDATPQSVAGDGGESGGATGGAEGSEDAAANPSRADLPFSFKAKVKMKVQVHRESGVSGNAATGDASASAAASGSGGVGGGVGGSVLAGQVAVETQASFPSQSALALGAQSQAEVGSASVGSASNQSQSQEGGSGQRSASQAAANALAADSVKSSLGQHPAAAFELPRELQAAVNTSTGTPEAGTKVSVTQQVSAEQRAQTDQEALNTARLHRGLASAVKQNGGAVTLRLTPPEIGTVRIELQMSGTTLSAAFHTETASAMSLINRQLDQLRTSLETQGLNVDKVTVQTMPSAQNQADAGQQQDNGRDSNGRSGQPGAQRDREGDSEAGDQPNDKPNSFNRHLDEASPDAE